MKADTPPIVCDMTAAPDTPAERLAEYERLFTEALIGRERIDGGIRFRFRAAPGLQDWVVDLAAREQACCAFFAFTVTVHDEELWWEASVVDDDMARQILNEFYGFPETVIEGVDAMHRRFTDQGVPVMVNDGGTSRPASNAELGLTTSP
jgi:hypothetical protein